MRRCAIVPLAALACSLGIACDRHDSHDHAAPAAAGKVAAHDGHDHGEDAHAGHDHSGHGDEIRLTADALRRSGIRIATAEARSLATTIDAPARVAFNDEAIAHVGPAVAGRVVELPARVGSAVTAGDVLAVIESPDLADAQGTFLQRRAALEAARPTVELTRVAADRAQQLYDRSQGISLTDVQARQRDAQAAQAELVSAEAGERAARFGLRRFGLDDAAIDAFAQSGKLDARVALRSPIAGQITARAVTLGEWITPDAPTPFTVNDLTTLWAIADIAEVDLAAMTVGAPASVETAAGTFEGQVAYIDVAIDSAARVAKVRIELPNAEGRLRPGAFGRASIHATTAGDEPTLAVPESAIHTVEGDSAIFVPVEGEPNTFAPRPVGTGPTIAGWVPVFAGLKPGERYVASGGFLLKAELGKAGAAHAH